MLKYLLSLCLLLPTTSLAIGATSTPGWVKTLVESWRVTWQNSAKLNHTRALNKQYHPKFRHLDAKLNRRAYMKRLEKGAKKYASWTVKVSQLVVLKVTTSQLKVQFRQVYRRPGYEDLGTKTLVWRKHSGTWKVFRERWKALPKPFSLCEKLLVQKAKSLPVFRAYLSIPGKYLMLDDEHQKRWHRKGKTKLQRIRWFGRCAADKKTCWKKIYPRAGVIQFVSNCTMGGVTFSYIGAKKPIAMIYMWSPTMTFSYTFLVKKKKRWVPFKAIPKPNAHMKRWMKTASPYPNNGCPYSLLEYEVYPASGKLEMRVAGACNSDPPPTVWLATYRWRGGGWKLIKQRKKKPRFKSSGDSWKLIK